MMQLYDNGLMPTNRAGQIVASATATFVVRFVKSGTDFDFKMCCCEAPVRIWNP